MSPPDDPLERLTALLHVERSALVAIAREEGANAEDALECVQEALCTWLRRERDGTPVANDEHAVAALKLMVRNEARNGRRRHHRARPHLELVDEALAAPLEDAESLLAYAEDVVRLRTCVDALCGLQRSVVLLRLLEERSGEDVAATLGVTRGHVDVLVHRAKASLRVCMRHPR